MLHSNNMNLTKDVPEENNYIVYLNKRHLVAPEICPILKNKRNQEFVN